jgi:acyl-coenzyme A synthetase/AMP-(fatty) acid ligase
MNDLFDTYEKTRIAKSKTLNDVATISHTSGTIKGIHKPIPLSDRQLNEACARFLHNEDFVKFKQSSFLMGLSPTAGIYPLVNAMMLPLAYGCHIVILPGEVMMNPMAIEALVEFKIRVFFSFPRIIEVMMRFENFG